MYGGDRIVKKAAAMLRRSADDLKFVGVKNDGVEFAKVSLDSLALSVDCKGL